MKLGQLKRAFWATFHQSGELWFPYPRKTMITGSPWAPPDDDPNDLSIGEDVTESHFREFLAALTQDYSWTIPRGDDSSRESQLRPLSDDEEIVAGIRHSEKEAGE